MTDPNRTDASRRPSPLAVARFGAGLTQQELADRARLDRETVSRAERGDGSPTLRTARKLAAALGLPFEDVFPTDGPDR